MAQSAAELAEAILKVIERGGWHAWVEVAELCASEARGLGGDRAASRKAPACAQVSGGPAGARLWP